MPGIKFIIAILESRNGRHYGFRVTRCSDQRRVEGHINASESNLLFALTNDGNWRKDCYRYSKQATEKEIFGLPYAGTTPVEIREFVRKQFAKRKKTDA